MLPAFEPGAGDDSGGQMGLPNPAKRGCARQQVDSGEICRLLNRGRSRHRAGQVRYRYDPGNKHDRDR